MKAWIILALVLILSLSVFGEVSPWIIVCSPETREAMDKSEDGFGAFTSIQSNKDNSLIMFTRDSGSTKIPNSDCPPSEELVKFLSQYKNVHILTKKEWDEQKEALGFGGGEE
jgi:hypothetical protein